MSRAKPWKIVNGDLTLFETSEPQEITERENHNLWYFNDNNDLFTKFPNIELFKEDFPNSVWKWHYKNNDLNNYRLELAKFTKDFPYNIWKLEDMKLMINLVKNVAKFTKDFPYNVWKYKNEIICDDEELNISIDTDVMNAFSNAAELTGELVIPKSVDSIEDYAFINSKLTHVLVPSECLFNPTKVFPKNCEIEYYD